jgi:hypothetical protein
MLGEYGETLVVDWGMAKVLEVKGEEFRSRELKKRTVFRAPRAPTAAIRPMQHGSVTFWERRNT